MFKIDLRKNGILGVKDYDDISVDEAIFSIYTDYENFTIDIWFTEDLKLRLDLRGDMSEIYNDVISMMESIENNKKEFSIHFLSSGFTASCHFLVRQYDIVVFPKWTSVSLFHHNTSVCNLDYVRFEKEYLFEKGAFISEWSKLLNEIKKDLISVGYNNYLIGWFK